MRRHDVPGPRSSLEIEQRAAQRRHAAIQLGHPRPASRSVPVMQQAKDQFHEIGAIPGPVHVRLAERERSAQ